MPRRQRWWARCSVGEQQLVEIAKALSLHTRILIMDEPTSALSVERGPAAARDHPPPRRRGRGGGLHLASDGGDLRALPPVTVLRDGALVGTVPIAQTSRAGLIRMMAGRDVQEFFHRGEPEAADASGTARRPPGAVGARSVAGQPAADGDAAAPGRRRRPRHRGRRGGGPRRADGRRPHRAAGNPVRRARRGLRRRDPGRRQAGQDRLAAAPPSGPGWRWSPRTASATGWCWAPRSRAISP